MRWRAARFVGALGGIALALGSIPGCAELPPEGPAGSPKPQRPVVAPAGPAMRFVELVDGRPCGDAGGLRKLIRNKHPSKRIRATIRIDSNHGPSPQWVTEVLAPGEQKAVGCSLIRAHRYILVFEFKVTKADVYPAAK
ncbi:MAG: hypothetical protein ACE5IM_12225 [Nitrospinota bacterium]